MAVSQEYITNEFGAYIGKTIATIRPMTKKEVEDMAWSYDYDEAFVIIFTDGSALIPSQDPEGNGAGFLFTADVTPVR